MNKYYSGQKFKFNLYNILNVSKYIDSSYEYNLKDIGNEFGMGEPKVISYIQYLKISDLIDNKNKITIFGDIIGKINDKEIIMSLIFYKLSRGWENGGHLYFSRLVNNILFDLVFSYDKEITSSYIKEQILKYRFDTPKVSNKLIENRIQIAYSSLCDLEDGFGKLGLLKKINNDSFKVYSYKPHFLVSAYIIFDRWPKDTNVIDFDYINNGDYNLRRLFFLYPEDIDGILSKLEQEKYLKIERKAGLNQIVKNPKIKTEDILEDIKNAFGTK